MDVSLLYVKNLTNHTILIVPLFQKIAQKYS